MTAEALAVLSIRLAEDEAKEISISRYKYWDHDATVYTFDDGSKLLITSYDCVYAIKTCAGEMIFPHELLAECPYCKTLVGYYSTDYDIHGSDVVWCSDCNNWLEIKW